MSQIVLTCCFAALLGSCAVPNAQQSDWARARLACADVGIDPGNSAFNQCVADLYYSVSDAKTEAER